MELEHPHLAVLLLTTETDLREAREALDGSEESRLRYVAAESRAQAAYFLAWDLLEVDPRMGRA